jgi:hypothetical protein
MLQIIIPNSGVREILGADDCQVRAWGEVSAMDVESSINVPDGYGSYYGFVTRSTEANCPSGRFKLSVGMYFCLDGPMVLRGGAGFLVRRTKYRGLSSIGGPIEKLGRLRYIDGCTDSLLIAPPRLGDPCLNHLHFPKQINQTMHTHPSVRVGVIARGQGVCRELLPNGETKTTKLKPGLVWLLPAGSPHCFATEDETMDVVAWHPDSDAGPTDEDHPMVNRTIVDGVSASKIDAIKTSKEVATQ